MKQFVMKKRTDHPVANGLISLAIILVVASVGWVIWSQLFKAIFVAIGGSGLKSVDQALQDQFLLDAVEGSFFWIVISTWVWFSLDLGNYGKYAKTTQQPQAGLRYTGLAFLSGVVAFFLFTGLMGIWWEPYKWSILFTPKNEVEVLLAIKGWASSNFFALSVILAQIPIVSIFQRYPFSKYSKSDWSIGFGTLSLSLFIALLNWNTFILPSFVDLHTTLQTAGGDVLHAVTNQPMGAWPTALAWAQIFIFFFLIPAEGGELYPQKLITDKQPWSGFVGLAIALAGAFLLLPVLRNILTPLANSLDMAPDLAVASFVLTIINVMLTWHHHFYDFPTETSLGGRLFARLAIVLVVGSVFGIIWLKFVHVFPFGSNDLGLGHPMLGLMGGQFVYMMPMLFMNTFFDKWPAAKSVEQ